MDENTIEVIATSISGSIRDWRKVERIVPLFKSHGRDDVSLHVVDSHAGARERARALVAGGSGTLISAGGSGTFNSIVEGCIDSGVGAENVTLGFLRKGSADLLGKALGMPDDIESAIRTLVAALDRNRTVACDVIETMSGEGGGGRRHFVGYGGAEIFGMIPRYTENRFIKYYKGVLGQLFGDLGPFFVGAVLAASEKVLRRMARGGKEWTVDVDGREAARGRYQAFIIVNGDLGPDLPFARGVPLGSGDFHVFALRDLGVLRLPGQFRRAWNATILAEAERWGFESYRIEKTLALRPEGGGSFPVNVDGSTLRCNDEASFAIVGRIRLLSAA